MDIGFWIMLIMFVAVLTQSVVGFGLALVSMPLLVGLVGVQAATPLVAVVGFVAELLLLIRFREALNLRAVSRLSLAAVFGVPVGVTVLRQVDTAVVTTFLGIVIVGYALYALADLHLPQLAQASWAWGFGFVAGILSGAYSTSGPPVVIYGNCRRWSPAEFKGNLQGFFLLMSVLTIVVHGASGNFTAVVWQGVFWAVPGVVLGLLGGLWIDGRVNPQTFRKLVLLLLIILGLRLIFAA
jgi:uncharacterized membrane protein YfcA